GVGEEALTILGPGDFFGEVEFFDGGPASAHAIAHSDCEVFAIPHQEVQAIMDTRPALAAKFLWAFSRTLATRLRESNQKISSLFAIAREF
ncbi:MAG: cyclic nucleotide-binding domain-containing protein, partial [Acidobacteria bacterium]